MSRQQFSRRPLGPTSIRAAVRDVRRLADRIERYADPEDSTGLRHLTQAIYGLSRAAALLSARHRGVSVAEDMRSADDYDAAQAETITREDYDAIESMRADGLGHWPRGKSRSTLTAAERDAVIRKLRKQAETESIRSIARTLGVSDRAIRNLLSGEDQPTERMQSLVMRL